MTKVHCLGIYDIDSGAYLSFVGEDVQNAVKILQEADLIVGHNVTSFDIPALQKVYPWFKPRGLVRDTLILTRLFWPHIKDRDFTLAAANKLPKKLIGRHSLEAWGHRIGTYKGDFRGPWNVWTQEMHDYMEQDVRVTVSLWDRCLKEAAVWGVPICDPAPQARKDCIALEHRVADIVSRVERHGFAFDEERAINLVATLTAHKLKLEEELQRAFPPVTVETVFVPKVNNRKLGYVKGEPFIKRVVIPFSPSSRQQIGERLREKGWQPQAFGKDGNPTVDDDILQSLPFPEAKLLSEYFVVEKRLGQIAHGGEAWLRHSRGGRIHGRIQANGAHTGRMTHSNPNMAQVPGNHAPYGEECRACFRADPGMVLVGCDADALELRDLAGYMARYDGGAYIETVLRGDKAKGTDMHTINAKLIGCGRDEAKVFFYALIYGAGDAKLGRVLGKDAQAGKDARLRLMKGLPALKTLVELVQKRIEDRGYLVGLDGRRLFARAKNAALNTLLQSAGAVQMKRGLVILYDRLIERGWEWGKDFAIVGLIHDEWQATVRAELADDFGREAVSAIRAAGEFYSFQCPLDGQYKKGETWAETH